MNRLSVFCVLGIVSSLALAVAPFDWPTYNHDSVRSGQIPVVPMNRCSLVWTYTSGVGTPSGSEHGSPVSTESILVYATSDGRLRGINAQTGTLRWMYQLGPGGQQPGTPVIWHDGDSSFVMCAFGVSSGWNMYCRRLNNGTTKWTRTTTVSAIESDPVVITYLGVPTIYFGRANGTILALNARTGAQLYAWSVNAGTSPIAGAIATDGTDLYVASRDSGVYKYTPGGARLWRSPVYTNCRTGVAYCNGRVFFGGDSAGLSRLICLNAPTGARVWMSGAIGSMAMGIPSLFDTNMVFVGTQTCSLLAYRQRDGSRTVGAGWGRGLWAGGAGRQVSGGVAVTTLDSGRVYVSAGYPNGYVFVVDRATGIIRESIPHPSAIIGMMNSVARTRNWLYVKDFSENLLAYYIDDFVPDRDVGCSYLEAPVGGFDSGAVVTPACSVTNYGNTTESYSVRMRIGTMYNQIANVSLHTPGTTVYLTFPNWVASVPGRHAVTCSTQLATDMERANDLRSDSVDIYHLHDVGCTRLLAPSGTIDSGMTVTPSCSVFNYGIDDPIYYVRMKIGTGYVGVTQIQGHLHKTAVYVTFPAWTATARGAFSASCSTELGFDGNPGNDKATADGTVRVRDASVRVVIAPTGTVDSGTIVTPACSAFNHGTDVETYEVRCRIGTDYNTTRTAASHQPGTAIYLTFPDWTASPRGAYPVSCSTELFGDMTPGNNRARDSVLVRVLDVGPTQVSVPSGRVDSGRALSPRVQVRNWGNSTTTCDIRLIINDSLGSLLYDTTETGLTLGGGLTGARTFTKTWTPTGIGICRMLAYSIMPGDATPANDTVRDSCTVVPPQPVGWSPCKPMPATPSNRQVKDGGWLAYDAGTDLIYAAKGQKEGDFYSYDVDADTWYEKAQMPLGTENKMPSKGAVGCADGNGRLYALKGNNTCGYYRYDAGADSWTQLVDVPVGASNKKVKGGSSVVRVDADGRTYVYLLKGYENEFYRWRIPLAGEPDTAAWQVLADAPGSTRWDKGSWILWDEATTVYAHKAKYHEFYAYDITSDSWTTVLNGMPFISRTGKSKKSKDGGSSAWLDGLIFALKGGNTQEFWRYTPGADTWAELDTMPVYGTEQKKKKVKAGAGVAAHGGDIYALKGNKTLEFWRYHPSRTALPVGRHGRSGILAQSTARTDLAVDISPNPVCAGRVLVRFALSGPGLVDISIIDVTGRAVQQRVTAASRTGTIELDLRRLAAGVYVVRLDASGFTVRRKLIIQH